MENTTSNYKENSQFHFSIPDYWVFGALLLFSTAIGIYFGYINYISGATMLGTPSEIYNYGTQYWLIIVAVFFMAIAVSKFYIPVFLTLKVTTSYEYLEIRFGSRVRTIASLLFILETLMYAPIVLYVPALAFNQVTGINVYIISSVVSVIVVIYTILGGIKAVVHTDVWQTFVMFIGLIVVVIIGTIYAGGPGPVFQHAAEGGRIIFANINPSLYERQSLWAVLIGGFFYWAGVCGVNQTMVQRYVSLPTLKSAEQAMIIFTICAIIFLSFCCFAGLLIFDYYRNCDPLRAGFISNNDQLLPFYVMQTVGHLHGIPGIVIAAIFGAALSSMSVVFNSISLVVLEDILRGCFKLKLGERASTVVVKFTIIIEGILSVAFIYILEQLSGILSIVSSLVAVGNGTVFAIFTLGMLVPWTTTKGALTGAIAGAILSGWAAFGAQAARAKGQLGSHALEVSVAECPVNSTLPAPGYIDESEVFPLYRLSYHWITVIGVVTTLLVGTVTSFLCGPKDLKTLNADEISPVMHRFLPKECFNATPNASPYLSRANSARTSTHLLTRLKQPSAPKKY